MTEGQSSHVQIYEWMNSLVDKKKKNRTLLGDIIYGKPIAQN